MLTWIVLIGCRDVVPDEPTSSGTTSETEICEVDSDCPVGTICDEFEGEMDCVDGDRNNSLDEAEHLLWEDIIEETINPAGDMDYFTFTARGGEYIRIATTSEFEDADTVVTLRDSTGQVVTWSDDFPTGTTVTSLDSVIYAYLPYEGDYLISVEDYYAYMDPNEGYGSPNYEYSLELSKWSQATQEPDSPSEGAFELNLDGTNMWNSIGVHIGEDGDSDWVKINYSAKDEDGNDSKFLTIAGVQSLDGSNLTPHVKLYNEDQELVAEKSSVGSEGQILFPDMSEGTYFIEITDAGSSGSEAHWTYIFLLSRANSPYPLDIEPNNSDLESNSIEMVPLQTDSESEYTVGRQMGYFSDSNDTDWFQFPHDYEDGQTIICLNSQLHGSNAEPTVDIFDSNGELLSENTCDPDGDPNLSAVLDGVDVGTIIFSVTPTSENVGLSDWYQMLVYSTSFDATSFSCP